MYEENCKDMRIIEHPAYFIGRNGLYLFFKDEHEKLYFLKRNAMEPEDMFDIGCVIDADEALPVTADPEAKRLAMNEGGNANA